MKLRYVVVSSLLLLFSCSSQAPTRDEGVSFQLYISPSPGEPCEDDEQCSTGLCDLFLYLPGDKKESYQGRCSNLTYATAHWQRRAIISRLLSQMSSNQVMARDAVEFAARVVAAEDAPLHLMLSGLELLGRAPLLPGESSEERIAEIEAAIKVEELSEQTLLWKSTRTGEPESIKLLLGARDQEVRQSAMRLYAATCPALGDLKAYLLDDSRFIRYAVLQGASECEAGYRAELVEEFKKTAMPYELALLAELKFN